MVKYEHIIKAVEDYLRKCTVTLKEVRSHIIGLVESIATTPEDVEPLIDTITHFYRDTYNKPKEYLICRDYNGNEWFNESDDVYNAVEVPEEAYEEGQKNGLMFSIHNHPDGSAFPSPDDSAINVEQNEEYSIIVGKKEITITKQDTNPDDAYIVEDVGRRHYFKHFNIMREANYDGIRNITDKISSGKIPVDEGQKELNKKVNKYVKENMGEMVNDLNKMYKGNGVDITVSYVQW